MINAPALFIILGRTIPRMSRNFTIFGGLNFKNREYE